MSRAAADGKSHSRFQIEDASGELTTVGGFVLVAIAMIALLGCIAWNAGIDAAVDYKYSHIEHISYETRY